MMSTEDEQKLQQRIETMTDVDLVRTLFLFEHVEAIDVHMRDMMAVVFPTQQLPGKEIDMVGMLRAELRNRILKKSRSAS